MLLPFSLSASPAGQLLYLILRVRLVKSAFSVMEAAGSTACGTKIEMLSGAFGSQWISLLSGNFSILSLSLSLSNRLSVTVFASPAALIDKIRGVGSPMLGLRHADTQGVFVLKEGVGSPLEGARPFGLLALPCGANR